MRARVLILSLGMMLLMIGSVLAQGSTQEFNSVEKHVFYGRYVQRGIIRINNNSEFAQIAQQEGWQGNGTADNPYIIEGYEIDAHGAGNAIYIGNTTVYFVIKNCYLHNASHNSWPYFDGDGLTLYNVTNGTLENNTCSNNTDGGILLDSSNNSVITNNTCNNNNLDGIVLDSSNNSVITSNTCSNNSSGINLYSSSSNVITNNTCNNNSYYGLILGNSSGNLITNNLISYNTHYGIYIYSGSHNHIYNNTFYYNHGSGDTYNSSHIQAYDNGTNNHWNSTTGIGNYWHDWANNNDTNDQNHDGIVDWPYKIDGSAGAKDYYPLKNSSVPVPEIATNWAVIIIALISFVGIHIKNFQRGKR